MDNSKCRDIVKKQLQKKKKKNCSNLDEIIKSGFEQVVVIMAER